MRVDARAWIAAETFSFEAGPEVIVVRGLRRPIAARAAARRSLLRHVHEHVMMEPEQCLPERALGVGGGQLGWSRTARSIADREDSSQSIGIVEDDSVRDDDPVGIDELHDRPRKRTDGLSIRAARYERLTAVVVSESPCRLHWLARDNVRPAVPEKRPAENRDARLLLVVLGAGLVGEEGQRFQRLGLGSRVEGEEAGTELLGGQRAKNGELRVARAGGQGEPPRGRGWPIPRAASRAPAVTPMSLACVNRSGR